MKDIERELSELISAPEGHAVLFLAPLAIVAWMDGRPELNELIAIAGHHASERCGEELGCLSEDARQFFYFHFVYARPSSSLVGVSLTLLADALSALPPDEAEKVLALLNAACDDVARAHGGGVMRQAVSEQENRAIGEMLEYVRPRHKGAATELAASFGLDDDDGGNK